MLRLQARRCIQKNGFISQATRLVYTTVDNNDRSKEPIKVPTAEDPISARDAAAEINRLGTPNEIRETKAVGESAAFQHEAQISTNSTNELKQKQKAAQEAMQKLKVEEELERSKLQTLPTPKALKRELDEYIIGQEKTKKIISVALYKHQFVQHLANIEKKFNGDSDIEERLKKIDPELEKSNMLLLGPSGSGKTLIAKTLARILKLPISITDCTSLTQAGFVGEDCESCIEKLLINANYDVELCQRGIVVLDEIDKLAKPAVYSGTKDIAGEGVQQGLLKLIEGANVTVKVKNYANVDKANTSSSIDQNRNNAAEQNFIIDTSNILFISMGAFIGLDHIIAQRFKSSSSIGFDDSQDSPSTVEASSSSENGEGDDFQFQDNITRVPDEELKSSEIAQVKLANGSKISALQLVSPVDLQQFGIIPELIGRLPILTALDPLSINNLVEISTEPKNSIVKQYEFFFNKIGVRLALTNEAIKKIAKISILNGTGARGLRSILEKILLTVTYDCPGSGISFVLIDKEVINKFEKQDGLINGEVAEEQEGISAKYFSRGEIFKFLNNVAQEDPELASKIEVEYNIPQTSAKKEIAVA